jgi:hypothetical protein
MKITIKFTIIAILLMITSGCASLKVAVEEAAIDVIIEQGTKELTKPAIKYCKKSASERDEIRAKLNAELELHDISVRLYCPGD